MGFWEPLFFWIFAIGAIGSSAAVVIFRNPLYSALSLILDFFFFAGLYVLLSAHTMAIIQVLVYAGAIMVLFLFIIMLLNLKDEELGEFEFKLHHLLSLASVLGLFFFIYSAIAPLVDEDVVGKQRAVAAQKYEDDVKRYEAALAEVDKAGDDEKKLAEARAKAEAIEPKYTVRTKSALLGPLYSDLSEPGLDQAWGEKIAAYRTGRSDPSQGKWTRFDRSKPMIVPPVLTGERLETERGVIKAREPAGFGTVEPMSILVVNRFVVPFELTALLLLAAIVGAVIIAKRRL